MPIMLFKPDPPYDSSMKAFPERDFMFYFNDWIQEPSDPCPLGERLHMDRLSRTTEKIDSSYFRTSFAPLRGQDEFINAYKSGNNIVKEITKLIPSMDMLPTPHFHIFTQYQNIVLLTVALLTVAMLIIYVISTFC